MVIVDNLKFFAGIVCALVGVVLLIVTRRERGFGQKRQAGVLFLVAAVALIGVGLGKINL